MVSSTLARGLLVLAIGFASQAEGVCTRTITARTGDTCASLADLAGITVTQFLRANPYVTSCETLISGATYCAEGTADSAPSAPAAPTRSSVAPTSVPSGGPLKVSTDGTCGGSVTCAGSRFGTCCSAHGFCGNTADYCGDGCQAGLGQCDNGGGSSAPPASPTTITPAPGGVATTTTTITATIFVTNTVAETTGTTTSTVLLTSTSLSYANTTSTVIQSTTATATATQTIRATVIVTSTLFQTSTIISNVTSSTTATSVAVVTSTSTSWRTSLTIVTRTVQVTSVEVDTLTTILTSTSIKAVTSTAVATSTSVVTSTRVVTATNYGDCDSQPQPTFIIGSPTATFIIGGGPRTTPGGGGIFTTITQIQPGPARPSPVLPGAPSNCKSYDKITTGDTCRDLATRNNVSLRDFYKLNPSIDCDNLRIGYYVCTGQ